jgi:L-ascorbate metabolism protein UlaG (beta-lactamase superfamily)
MNLTRKEFLSFCLSFAALGVPALTSAAHSPPLPKSINRKKEVQIEWLGHGSFKFISRDGKVILLDPWISSNPKIPGKYRTFTGFEKVDLILFTHGHVDHFMLPDVKQLIKKYNPDIIAPWELQFFIKSEIPTAKCMTFQLANQGGTYDYHGVKLSMVHANHSSGAQLTAFTGTNRFMGQAVGYIMEFENGYKVYHSGDTGLMSDMKLVIGDYYKPDIAILPIGNTFTMGPREAAYACTMIQPSIVIPGHYGTFPVLEQTPKSFISNLDELYPASECLPLEPGENTFV